MCRSIEKRIKDTEYFELYKQLKDIVRKNIKDIELSALLVSVKELKDALKNSERDIDEIIDLYPIVYLNSHDINHVERVLDRAEELLSCIKNNVLDSYEIYILMCAILVHDAGNLEGRRDHTLRVSNFLNANCATILEDGFERKIIGQIASAHGGEVNGSKDTISVLKIQMPLKGIDVRTRFLAAILRFADELADDSSRVNWPQSEMDKLPEESLIYHFYSKCLHSVQVKNDNFSNYIKLTFALSIEDATITFKTFKGEQYLLDEIYQRTLKMERERIYCNKFFQPLLFIDRIEVEINIYDQNSNSIDLPFIKYVLEEQGYPVKPAFYTEIEWDGKKLKEFLSDKVVK